MQRRIYFAFIAVCLLTISLLGTIQTSAATADITVDAPSTVNIGEDFTFSVTFDNNGPNEGYGPFVDVVIPVNGADGNANTNSPLDGIRVNSVDYLGSSLSEVVTQTFPDTPLGANGCSPSQTALEHPLAVDINNAPLIVCGTPGDQLITVQLPFGSFTVDQPPAEINFNATLDSYADLNAPLDIRARGGYQYGDDALDNYCCDPSDVTDGPDSSSWTPTDSVTPTLLDITKTNDAPENETATGPNYPRSYTVTLNVADGQTLTNVTISDYFDSNIIITGIGGFSPAGSVEAIGGSSAFSFPYQASAEDDVSNSFEVLFPTVTGSGAGSATFTVDFYIGEASGSGGSVIPPTTGDDNTAGNRVRAVASWDPLDPRDSTTTVSANGTCPSCPPDDTLELGAIEIQKSVNNDQPVPGEVVTYTHEVQLSDYFAFDDLVVSDVLSDGQRWTGTAPTLSVTQHGSNTSSPIDAANYTFAVDSPGTGETNITLNLSDELALRSFGEGTGALLGGCVPAGGTGGSTPDCASFNGGQTTLTVTYDVEIQDNYSDTFPSGDPSVDQGDVLTNTVDITGTVLDTGNLTPTDTESDDSSAQLEIPFGDVTKSVYAINGNTGAVGSPTEVLPGDRVTYRIQYTLTTTDFEDLQITDYLPLPVLKADDPNADGTAGGAGEWSVNTGAPAYSAGEVAFGPADTFYGFTNRTPTIGTNTASNSVTFDFGNFDDTGATSTTLDLLLTVAVDTDPFADGLFLTNQAEVSEGTTQQNNRSVSSIVQIVLREPVLQAKKGIVDTTSPLESFDSQTDPDGITMDDAGSAASPPWSGGDITGGSGGNVDSGLDANADGVDASDTVRYSVTIQNTGGSGAYDIELYDVIPNGLVCNSATVNLQVHQGDGTTLPYSIASGGNVCDFFTNFDGDTNDGLIINDPAAGACQSPEVDPAKAVIVITYDLEIDNSVGAGDLLLNTATITNYSNVEGGENFLDDGTGGVEPITDDAELGIIGTLSKTIAGTSETESSDAEDGTAGNERPVLIGEVVTYELEFQVPEGTTNNVQIVDNLPDGLQYIANTVSATSNSGGVSFTNPPGVTTGGTPGDDVTFDFGTVTNTDNDDDSEFITVTFDAVVSNIAGNQAGTIRTNNADLLVDGNLLVSSEDRSVVINEPNLTIDKRQLPTFNPANGPEITVADAGDTIFYRIFLTNTGDATAYDVTVTDIFPNDYVGNYFCCTTTGSSGLGATIISNTPNLEFYWAEIPAGSSVSVSIEVNVRDGVAPGESWTNTATVDYSSLPGDQGTGNATPGNPGDDDGERNNADGAGGAVDNYEASDTTDAITVPDLELVKQIEHPSQTPVAGIFGGTYSDSTNDANTGVSEHNASTVDLAIGEEFNYIITVTFPEGTTYNMTPIDLAVPLNNNGGRQNRVVELLDTEVIHVGSNLTLGGGLVGLGGSFTIVDSNGDGDGSRFQAWTGSGRDVFNNPDGVEDDNDRYVIRVRARLDDEDDGQYNGGLSDDLAIPGNNDGDTVQNKVQLQWDDQDGTTTTQNPPPNGFANGDAVEPDLSITKTANPTNADAGDTVSFTLTLTNNGTAPAYDIAVSDAIPADLTFDSLDLANSTCDARDGYSTDSTAAQSLSFSFDDLLVGESCDFVFDVTVDFSATPNATLTNTATIDTYSSQPGTPADDRTYNPVSDTADVTIFNVTPVKSIDSTGETSTSDTPDGSSGNERPVAIGEVVTFSLAVDIPEGTSDNVVLTDILVSGIDYIPGTGAVYTISASAMNFAGLGSVSTDPNNPTPLPDGSGTGTLNYDAGTRTATIDLGNITNNDSDPDAETVVVTFDVVVVNSSVNNIGQIWTNQFNVSVNGNPSVSSNAVGIVINEPDATVTKTINAALSNPATTGPFDAGDTVVYDIVVTNPSGTNISTAFDLSVLDTVDGDLSLDSVTFVGTPATSTPTDNSTLGVGGTVDVTIDQLQPGESLTIRVTTTAQTTVTQAEIIANVADLTYTSLPGTNGTNDATPGASGDTTGERNGNDGTGGVNDYVDQSQVDFSVSDDINATKTIAGTSEPGTSDAEDGSVGNERPVAIGEVVTFELSTRLIEGTNTNLALDDTFVAGIEYIPGSAVVYALSDNPISAPNLGDGITLDTDVNNAYALNPTTEAVYDSGTSTLTVNLGDMVNNDSDTNDEFVVVRFDVIVVNTSVNNVGQIWTNDFTVTADGGVSDTSNEVGIVINEPDMTLDKTINAAESNPASTGPFDGGDTVVYDISIGNISSANSSTAYDIEVLDDLDVNLSLVSMNVFSPGYVVVDDSGTVLGDNGSVNVVLSELRPGDVVVIRVTTTVQASVTQDQIILNMANGEYTSLPGTNGTNGTTPGSPGDDNGERDSSGGVNDYVVTDDETFTASSAIDTEKSIAGTSDPATSDSTADTSADPRPVVVGETITYRLVTDVGELTSPDVVLRDILAPNIEYVANSTRISYIADTDGNITIANATNGILNESTPTTAFEDTFVNFDGGTRELSFALGEVVNSENDANAEQVIIEFDAQVVDIGTLGDIWANDYGFDANGDGTNEDTSNQVSAVLAEPELTLAKVHTGTGPYDAGDTVSYELTLSHTANSTSDAFNIVVTDTLPLASMTVDTNSIAGTCANVTYDSNSSTFTVESLTLANNSCTIQYNVTLDDDTVANTTYTNSAEATYDSLTGGGGRTSTTNTDTATINTTVPGIDKGVSSTSISDTGTAQGDPALTDLAIGEEVTFELTVNLHEGEDTIIVVDTLPTGLVPVSAAVTQVGSTVTNSNLAAGDNATADGSVTNPFITFSGQTVTFDYGTLTNPGDNVTDSNDQLVMTVTARVEDIPANSGGTILDNDVELQYSNSGTDTANESVEVVAPSVTLDKTFSPDEQIRGGTVTMTLVVSNLAADGATAPLYDIQVTDILDDWLDVTGVTPTLNGAASTYGTTVTTDNSDITAGYAAGVTDNIVVDIDALPVDGVVTIEVTMTIDPNVDPLSLPRTITNQADVTGDTIAGDDPNQRTLNENASDDLNVVKPTLLVTKTDSADPVNAGDPLQYTITIENTGTPAFDATNVIFTDELPTGFTTTLVNPSQGSCSPIVSNTLTCNLGTIAQGSTATVTISGVTSMTLSDGNILTNTAYVTSQEGNNGDDGDDTPDDGDDERAVEETTVGRAVDMEITKTVDDTTPNEGDLITYTLDVANNGPSDATNVVVTDTIPAGLTFSAFVPNTLPCTYDGGTTTLTCTFSDLAAGDSVTIGIEATVDAGTSGTTITNTATVTANEPDTNTANNSDSADITVDAVDIAVTKTVDNSTPVEGNSIVYSITATNNGPAPATTIQITDDINGVTGISYDSDNSVSLLDDAGNPTSYNSGTGVWTIGELQPGSSLTLEITATVDTGASAEPQPIVNTATRTATDQPDTDTANDSDTANIAVGGVDLGIAKGINDATPDENQQVVYTLQLTNNSNVRATNIVISDVLPAEVTYVSDNGAAATNYDTGTRTLTWQLPAINANGTRTLQITVTVDNATGGDTFTNTATIDSIDQTDSDDTNNSDDATATVTTTDLAVTKIVDNAAPAEGDTIVYSITATNNGPSVATGVRIADALPAGVTYVSDNSATLTDDTGATTTYNSSSGMWEIGQLNNGSSLTLEITVTVDSGASGLTQPITNTATVDNINETDSNPANNSDDANITVGGLDVALVKEVDNPTPSEGDTVIYTLTVTNNGPGDATGIEVTDNLPAGVTYDSDDGTSTTYNDPDVTWTVGTLANGESASLNITVTVDTATSGDTLTNTASITSLDQTDSDPTNNDDDADITVGAVDIAVDKVVDNSGPATGDNVTYTITVTNNGPGNATGIVIDESLPLDNVSLTYVSDTPSQGTFTPNNPPPSTWNVGALAAGESATLQLTVTVNIPSGSITNTASVNSVDQPDSDDTNNSDDATIAVGGVDLAVTKVVDPAAVQTGDTVVYSITAINNGPNTATGVTVLDILPAGVTYDSDNSDTLTDDTGSTTVYDDTTGNWTVGTLDSGSNRTLEITATVNIDGGRVTNTAEINGNEQDTDDTNNVDDATVAVDSADLSVTKSINTNAPQVGDTVTYTVTVTNSGPNTAFNVELTDQLPGGVSFVDATPSQGTFDSGTGVWDVGTLNLNQAESLLIEAQVTDPGLGTTNTVEVTASDQSDPDSTPNNGPNNEDDYAESTFLFDPPFGRKTFDDSGLPLLRWGMVWVNPGTSPVAVTISDPLPTGTSYVQGSLSCTSPGQLSTNRCEYDLGTNSVIFEGTVYPSPGATPATIAGAANPLRITFLVRVPDDTNEVFNRASLTTVNGDDVNATSTWRRDEPDNAAPVDNTQADILITKYADPQIAFPGEELAWVIEVTNPSSNAATGVTVTDAIPSALSINGTETNTGSVSISGQDVTWDIGTVQPGQTLTLRINTQVPVDLAGSVLNTAIVTGDNFEAADASALAQYTQELPRTGETPDTTNWLHWLLLAIVPLLLVSIGGGLWRWSRRSN